MFFILPIECKLNQKLTGQTTLQHLGFAQALRKYNMLYLCIYIYMYMYMYIYIYLYMYISIYVYMCVGIYIYIYMQIDRCIYVHIKHMYMHIYLFIYIYIYYVSIYFQYVCVLRISTSVASWGRQNINKSKIGPLQMRYRICHQARPDPAGAMPICGRQKG